MNDSSPAPEGQGEGEPRLRSLISGQHAGQEAHSHAGNGGYIPWEEHPAWQESQWRLLAGAVLLLLAVNAILSLYSGDWEVFILTAKIVEIGGAVCFVGMAIFGVFMRAFFRLADYVGERKKR
ncbi:MAG: hypothetical protein AB1705_07015 [Verrucomicrobiota bacterium]